MELKVNDVLSGLCVEGAASHDHFTFTLLGRRLLHPCP